MEHPRRTFPALEQRVHGLRQINFADAKYLEGGDFSFDKSAAPIEQMIQARLARDRELEEIEFLREFYEEHVSRTQFIAVDGRTAILIMLSMLVAFAVLSAASIWMTGALSGH